MSHGQLDLFTGQRTAKKDGITAATQHLLASGGWPYAKSDNGSALYFERPQTGHRWHNYHEWEATRCPGQYVWRPSTEHMEEG